MQRRKRFLAPAPAPAPAPAGSYFGFAGSGPAGNDLQECTQPDCQPHRPVPVVCPENPQKMCTNKHELTPIPPRRRSFAWRQSKRGISLPWSGNRAFSTAFHQSRKRFLAPAPPRGGFCRRDAVSRRCVATVACLANLPPRKRFLSLLRKRAASPLCPPPPTATLSIRSFGSIVTSTAAPIATGWSDSCRVGFAPTEDRTP